MLQQCEGARIPAMAQHAIGPTSVHLDDMITGPQALGTRCAPDNTSGIQFAIDANDSVLKQKAETPYQLGSSQMVSFVGTVDDAKNILIQY